MKGATELKSHKQIMIFFVLLPVVGAVVVVTSVVSVVVASGVVVVTVVVSVVVGAGVVV